MIFVAKLNKPKNSNEWTGLKEQIDLNGNEII